MYELLEREDKWDVDEHFVLPRLDDLISDGDIDHSTVHLESEYFDTAEHDLKSHGIVLRRRSGDDDTGWHLKVPGSDGGRVEIRTSLTDQLPSEIEELLTGLRLGKQLVSVATLRTERTRYRISRHDHLYAELADDQVHASVDHRLLAWREIEVEHEPESGSLPRRLAKRLSEAGARPSKHRSKLAHALGGPTPDIDGDAHSALHHYVGEQINAIFTGDLQLRRGQEPIHDTRVAIRRLRSTIRVFGKLMDNSVTDHVDEELKWFAGLLGEVRDRQVQRKRLREVLDEWPTELVLGPVANRIDTDLQSEQLRARSVVTEAMDFDRYLELLQTLQQWRADLPVAGTPSKKALRKRALRAERKADRRLAAAVDSNDHIMLHRARKAAKRARYAAELQRPLGKSSAAKKAEKHYKKIQRVLGDHQDSVVALDVLRRFALTAGTTPGENGFTYGLLYAREQQIAEDAREQARKLLR